MIRQLPACAAVLALLYAADARADSTRDNFGPRDLALAGLHAESTGSASTRQNPAGLSLNNQLALEAAYGYRPEDGAGLLHLSACDSTVPVAGCFYYNYFSAAPELGTSEFNRRSHEFGMSASRPLSQQIIIGLNGRYVDYNSDFAMEGDESGFVFDPGVLVRAGSAVKVGVTGHNFLVTTDSPQYPKVLATGIAVRPGGGSLGISADGMWDFDEEADRKTGRYGAGLEFFAGGGATGYPLRGGYLYDNAFKTSYLSGGLGFVSPKVALDLGGRFQVAGEGEELIIIGGLRFFPVTGQ